jgi:membrane protease subunit (stomatin/prohibitin family)
MNSHNQLESITILLDVILIGISFWMALMAAKLNVGGAIGKTVGFVVGGAIVLGLAHLVETFATRFGVSGEINEILHRLIILMGMMLLSLGIKSLLQTLGKSQKVK